jgi:hypothetical protein
VGAGDRMERRDQEQVSTCVLLLPGARLCPRGPPTCSRPLWKNRTRRGHFQDTSCAAQKPLPILSCSSDTRALPQRETQGEAGRSPSGPASCHCTTPPLDWGQNEAG